MNILYINHTVLKSGAGISLSTLLRYLPSEIRAFFMLRPRCEIVNMLAAKPEQTFYERFMVEFMTTRYVARYPFWLFLWHLLKTPIAFLRIWQLKRRWHIDLVHVNETTLIVYAFAARLTGLPVILHARTAISGGRFQSLLLRWVARLQCVRIVPIDGDVRRSLPKAAQQISRVVYNPIDLGPPPSGEATFRLRASWGFSSEHVVIGQVASLHAQKGVWMILELAEMLCAELETVRFVLVGDDSATAGEGPRIREAIAKVGLADRIVLPGYNSDLAGVYAAIDVALCLFGGELGGVGRGAYEAAMAGKPLIATLPDPKQSDSLVDGVNARVFSPDNKPGILQALRLFAANREEREKLGRSAQASIANRHAPESIAAAMFNLYSELRDCGDTSMVKRDPVLRR